MLGELPGDAKAEDAALTALRDDKPEVRAAAAQALGEMRAKRANAQLHAVLRDPEPSVIIAAAYALVQMGDDKGYDVYCAVLTGQQKTGTSLTDQQKKMLRDPKKMASLGMQAGIGFIPFGGLAMTGYKMLTRDDIVPGAFGGRAHARQGSRSQERGGAGERSGKPGQVARSGGGI